MSSCCVGNSIFCFQGVQGEPGRTGPKGSRGDSGLPGPPVRKEKPTTKMYTLQSNHIRLYNPILITSEYL